MEDKMIRVHTDGAKQTLGVHTDITFEINDSKNKSKKMDGKNAESDEDDDVEVPIYRGTHTENDSNNFNRRYDSNNHRHHMNRPSFHGVNDEEHHDTDTWIRFLPSASGQWTTERYSESFNPQSM